MHLSPEMVDVVADYLAIFVLVFVPALLSYLFWMVHILPEKIAERRGHPQADAIKTLCSLHPGGAGSATAAHRAHRRRRPSNQRTAAPGQRRCGFWMVGLNFFAPLFNAGALKAEVAIANAEQEPALALYGQTALRAFSEVETSLASEALLADQETYLQAVLSQDTEAVRLGRVRFDMGATDLFNVLQLQARQINTRFELITIRNSRLANRVALHLALGGGFTVTPVP